jgi:hypothetical protein
MLETTLYPAVKQFPVSAGFFVKGEMDRCDAVAARAAGRGRDEAWRGCCSAAETWWGELDGEAFEGDAVVIAMAF